MMLVDIVKTCLFSYGTLQSERVQLAVLGRKLSGTPDKLAGYILEQLRIRDEEALQVSNISHYPIAIATGKRQDRIEGIIYEISTDELLLVDNYEGKEYKRRSLCLKGRHGSTCHCIRMNE